MEEKSKGLSAYAAIVGIVITVLGVICLAKPQAMESMIIWIMGGIVIITGIVMMIFGKVTGNTGNLVFGAVLIIIGILMIVWEEVTKKAIGAALALFAIALGINRLKASSDLKKTGGNAKPPLISGILHLVFAALMLFMTFEMLDFMMTLIGIYLAYSGINIISAALILKTM
ncbi:MAG: DUF308 domain-containing protein [Anaerovoracaceae bacterium]|nr:DUF308 domain-containing protein [Anaerovoracaceae bacterium]